ncbi:hypothetical protein PIROE2DRAFT_7397 [Piromyces sp. E2]|nr:hypothetical protein PIROE2DRAFT_7397 [Piromyces sp. E2]|eukprot:OUM65556.1 hypothetical protein PIROE2DRAFT_7397 [Piromyces sp. E2]
MRGSYKYSNLFNDISKSNNFLPQISEQSKKKEVYEPQDFYYPITYEPKNNNYGSVSFRSKTNRFEKIKPTPHELDLEPYPPMDFKQVEHRVLNRPWLQQIQATLGDVFINDHTNDGIINSSKIMKSLNNEIINATYNRMIVKKNKKTGSKSLLNDNTNATSTNKLNKNDCTSSHSIYSNDDEISNQNSDDKGKKKYKNPYSECYFIKEPYKIITSNESESNEEEEKMGKYMDLFEDTDLTSPTTQVTTSHVELPDNYKESTLITQHSTEINNNNNDSSSSTTQNPENSINNENKVISSSKSSTDHFS